MSEILNYSHSRCRAYRFIKKCTICGERVLSDSSPRNRTCSLCGNPELISEHCVNDHCVCASCSNKGTYDVITSISFNTTSNNPHKIAKKMMSHPSFPATGGEYHAIVSTSTIASLKNSMPVFYNKTEIPINNVLIERVLDRTWKDRLSSCMYAGYGVCGTALSAGAVISVLIDSTCDTLKTKERNLAMKTAMLASAEIKSYNSTCCRLNTWLAIEQVSLALKNHFDIELPRKKVSCIHKDSYPHRCIGSDCRFF